MDIMEVLEGKPVHSCKKIGTMIIGDEIYYQLSKICHLFKIEGVPQERNKLRSYGVVDTDSGIFVSYSAISAFLQKKKNNARYEEVFNMVEERYERFNVVKEHFESYYSEDKEAVVAIYKLKEDKTFREWHENFLKSEEEPLVLEIDWSNKSVLLGSFGENTDRIRDKFVKFCDIIEPESLTMARSRFYKEVLGYDFRITFHL